MAGWVLCCEVVGYRSVPLKSFLFYHLVMQYQESFPEQPLYSLWWGGYSVEEYGTIMYIAFLFPVIPVTIIKDKNR